MDIDNVKLNEIDIEEVVELEVDFEQVGPRGLSAYEVYLKNGGTLSEREWLLSLKGEKGDAGEKGEKGEAGDLSQEHLDERTGLLSNLNTINKDNLVNAINEVNDSYIGDDIGVTYINLTSYDYSGSPSESFVVEEKNKMTKLINDLYRSKSRFTHLYLQRMIPYNFGKENQTQQSSNNLILDFGLCDVSMQSKQYLWYGDQIQGYNSFEKTYWSVGHEYVKLTITGTWTDNVFTCTSASIYRGSGLGRDWVKPASQSSLSNYLSKTNTTEYVPTSSFHPATKSYVDTIVGNINIILDTLVTVEEETN